MNTNIALLGILSGIAVGTSFFLATYFLFIKKKDKYKNNLLGFLFIATGLRIAKSIVYFIFIDVKSFGLALGYLGLSSIGPLLFIYIRAIRNNEKKFNKIDALHFVIPVIGFFLCLITHLGHITNLYKGVTALLLVYLVLTLKIHLINKYENFNIKKWNTNLLAIISLIWASFVSQHLTPDVFKYAIGTGVASIAIYYIFIYSLKTQVVFNKPNNKKIPNDIINKIKIAFESEKVYLVQAITLTDFAKKNNIPAYLVTESVKQLYGKSFPETINHFRIEDIKKTLLNNKNNNSKIETLAYEVGFNTPSTFYAAFKRETNMSPTQYQKRYSTLPY